MLRSTWLVARQTTTLLRRDLMLRPVLVAGIAITLLAIMASGWSLGDATKILYDVGFFGLQMVGSMAALFWGSKSVSDSRSEGAVEWQLAAPISRTSWFLGKYSGLALSILQLAVLLLGLWQLGMLVGGFGWMTSGQMTIYLLMVLGWLVLAALAVFYAIMMRFAVALFTAVATWLAGLTSVAVAAALRPETPRFVHITVRAMARCWDLQAFNLVDRVLETPVLNPTALAIHVAYGVILIALMLTAAVVVGNRGDICV